MLSPAEIPVDRWVDQKSSSAAFDGVKLKVSVVLEDVTAIHCLVDWTALFEMHLARASDWGGRFFEAESCGASIPSSGVIPASAFPSRSIAPIGRVAHVLRDELQHCQGQCEGRAILHVDVLRRRDLATIAEPWPHSLPQPLQSSAAEKELYKIDVDVLADFERHSSVPRR